MSTLVVEKEVCCPPSFAVDRIYKAFGAESAHEITHRLTASFEDLGFPGDGKLEREVLVTVGEPERKRSLTRIPLSWRVPGSHAYPVFRGFFEIQPLDSKSVQVALLGYYHPPYGLIGVAFDAVLGRRIAEATVLHLLTEICDAMEKNLNGSLVGKAIV